MFRKDFQIGDKCVDFQKNNVDYLKRSSNGTTFLELSKSSFKNDVNVITK